ncbi:MAG: sialidase family protein, partial [Anaerolineae bacterium]
YQPSIARLRASGGLALVFERLDGLSFAGDLYWTSSSDGGATWEVPRAAVATDASERHPALVQLAGGTLALFYLVDETGDGGYRLHRATSADGAEWTDAGAIYLGWPTPGEVNPDVIAEPDGTGSRDRAT